MFTWVLSACFVIFWPGYLCNTIVLQFEGNLDFRALGALRSVGLTYEGTVGPLDWAHEFSFDAAGHNYTKEVVLSLLADKQARKRSVQELVAVPYPVWFAEQIPRKREKRSISITDPEYPRQWHLNNAARHTHLNVEAAWEKGVMGEGVRIAIVDDGIQTTHPDLRDNAVIESSWNFNGNKQSPDPTYLKGPSGDWHGTASAGAAAGRDDGKSCGVGVAPRAQLAGVAILQNNANVGDAIEAKALSYMPQHNHIYSNSWGPIRPGSSGHLNEAPGPLAQAAIEKCIAEGRGGLGSIYVWAAGNDAGAQDQCNFDGYANMRYTILIGSTTSSGEHGGYSEPCSAMSAVTPGGPSPGKPTNIISTDLLGSNGLNPSGDCTGYTGTSASCPLAAGIVALILSVHPGLTWVETQYVVKEAAWKHIEDKSWEQNAAGVWFSNSFGFGLLDADRAVEAARRWKDQKITVEEKELKLQSGSSVKMQTNSGSSTLAFKETGMTLHHVEVWLYTTHRDVSTTTIKLTSPQQTTSLLAWDHSDKRSKWQGWRFLSRTFWGEVPDGEWKLTVLDKTPEQEEISSWTLAIYGNNTGRINLLERSPTPSNPTTEGPATEPQKPVVVNIPEEPGNLDLPQEFLLFVVICLVVTSLLCWLLKRRRSA